MVVLSDNMNVLHYDLKSFCFYFVPSQSRETNAKVSDSISLARPPVFTCWIPSKHSQGSRAVRLFVVVVVVVLTILAKQLSEYSSLLSTSWNLWQSRKKKIAPIISFKNTLSHGKSVPALPWQGICRGASPATVRVPQEVSCSPPPDTRYFFCCLCDWLQLKLGSSKSHFS